MQRVAHAFSYRTHKIDGHEKLQASYCSAYIGIIQNYLAVKAIMSQIYALHKAILANIYRVRKRGGAFFLLINPSAVPVLMPVQSYGIIMAQKRTLGPQNMFYLGNSRENPCQLSSEAKKSRF